MMAMASGYLSSTGNRRDHEDAEEQQQGQFDVVQTVERGRDNDNDTDDIIMMMNCERSNNSNNSNNNNNDNLDLKESAAATTAVGLRNDHRQNDHLLGGTMFDDENDTPPTQQQQQQQTLQSELSDRDTDTSISKRRFRFTKNVDGGCFHPFLVVTTSVRRLSTIGQSMTTWLVTDSRPFQMLVTHAFNHVREISSSSSSSAATPVSERPDQNVVGGRSGHTRAHTHRVGGEITKDELYVGLLVVHLNLAKYAGPAACYPPTRCVCDALFDAADWDGSNTIDQYEFRHIISIMCTQIIGRIVTYYIVLIVCVPVLARKVVSWTRIADGSWTELILDQIVNVTVFFVVIPLLWNFIDDTTERKLKQHPHRRASQIQSMSRRVSAVLMTPTAVDEDSSTASLLTTTIANESVTESRTTETGEAIIMATEGVEGGTSSSNDWNHHHHHRRRRARTKTMTTST